MDFDKVINRVGTHSMKWDGMEPLYGVKANEGISMWVADMDFEPPRAVTEALQQRIDHNVYGYFADPSRYFDALQNWVEARHGFRLETNWMINTHGLVQGVALCLNALTNKGDGVIVFSPVYHAFARTIRANERDLIESELVNTDGYYTMDLEGLQASLKGHEKMIIISSPHNPGGRVWTASELRAVADFANRNDLILVSDEIHMDMIFDGHQHQVFGSVAEDINDRLIYLMAATKSFNIAGGLTGTVIAPNEELRSRLTKAAIAMGIGPNLFGMIASTAAYEGGSEWMDACADYVQENLRIFNEGVSAIAGVKPMALESTYLAWVDFTALGLSQSDIDNRIAQDAKIAANSGPTFGKGGNGFARFNIATRRANITAAVERLQSAFADIQ